MANENGNLKARPISVPVAVAGYSEKILYKYLNCSECEKQLIPDGGTVFNTKLEMIGFAEQQHQAKIPDCINPKLVITFDSVLVSRKIK